MPWHVCTGLPLTRASLAASAPATPGVYGVFSGRRWIYFGESADVHLRLLEHLADRSHCIHGYPDLRYSVEVAPDRAERLRALLAEYRTPCNTGEVGKERAIWRQVERPDG
jgi:hypothetical protein